MITLQQARTLRLHDRISYTPTPLAGQQQEPPELGTIVNVLPTFTVPYRTVPARLIIEWDSNHGQSIVTLTADTQPFWDCVSILD